MQELYWAEFCDERDKGSSKQNPEQVCKIVYKFKAESSVGKTPDVNVRNLYCERATFIHDIA